MLAIVREAEKYKNRIAIKQGDNTFTYAHLIHESREMASSILQNATDLYEAPIAFMVNPGFDYVKVQWAIWQAGGICVPLFLNAPLASASYSIESTGATVIIVSPEYELLFKNYCTERSIRLLVVGQLELRQGILPDIAEARKAMILFTSGTTNLPKGVVTTHKNIHAQITSLVHAWEWNDTDHILCVLPLHHVHGIINVIGCAMWSGACCEFVSTFSPQEIGAIIKRGQLTLFMAVPTIYYKLIAYWESLPMEEKGTITTKLTDFRLMVCGSAALPVTVMEKWKKMSNHILLERYGMTEIGMALSNPYRGERKAAHVGLPLPGVNVRLCDDSDIPVLNQPGEIQVKGDTVFLEYWNNRDATTQSFTVDGWFKTGDIAEIDQDGYYKILGRNSQDIIKSGGYKISAIEIEEVLRQHPTIEDCSVIGLPDEEWGEKIAAVVTVNKVLDPASLDYWMRERLSKYKVPRLVKVVSELPRNAMGKVTKNELKKLFI